MGDRSSHQRGQVIQRLVESFRLHAQRARLRGGVRWLAVVLVFVLSFVMLGVANATIEAPENTTQSVEIKCDVADPTCEVTLDTDPKGGPQFATVLRAGPLPSIIPSVIRIPGPVRTIRVPVPGPVRTIFRRLPRRTVTAHPAPRTVIRTRTVTRTETAPGNSSTVTRTERPGIIVGPSNQPTVAPSPNTQTVTAPGFPQSTVTVTVPPDRTRQTSPTHGTIRPQRAKPDKPSFVFPRVELSRPEVVGLGLLGFGIMVAIIMLALWAGFTLGFKSAERENSKFLSALRDQLISRPKPR